MHSEFKSFGCRLDIVDLCLRYASDASHCNVCLIVSHKIFNDSFLHTQEYLRTIEPQNMTPWMQVPGFRIERIKWEIAHTTLLGCGKDLSSSVICDLVCCLAVATLGYVPALAHRLILACILFTRPLVFRVCRRQSKNVNAGRLDCFACR